MSKENIVRIHILKVGAGADRPFYNCRMRLFNHPVLAIKNEAVLV